MHFEFIADRVDAIPIVAQWDFDEWGHLDANSTLEKACMMISKMLNRDRAPLMVLAIEDKIVVGAAALKPHEMLSLYPNKEPWLGTVFVHPGYRNLGIASQLALRIVELARSFGDEQLYLQTERLDGGLYARLGWKPIELVNYRGHDVLVMEKRLGT
jgi:GNAT superfamily N-acetyltransferase